MEGRSRSYERFEFLAEKTLTRVIVIIVNPLKNLPKNSAVEGRQQACLMSFFDYILCF